VSTPGDPPALLAEALAALRATVAGTSYPLALPDAAEAGNARDFLVAQLDDYLLPRLAQPDAPLLAVVGGPTGAGKSTLVNSLAQAPVSPAGVLRPTTRTPVLVSHPTDTPWFRRSHLLPGLARTGTAAQDPGGLHLVTAPALTPGLALLDSPDIDSVVDSDRALAGKLFAAADLWLFVTSAARYADAVPWDLLRTARERGTAIALVLDRTPLEVADEVVRHFTELLTAHAFGDLPLFVVPETAVDGHGLLPEPAVAPLRSWLGGLARDPAARAAVTRRTVAGAVAAATGLVDGLAAAADGQVTAAAALVERARAAYRVAFSAVDTGVRDGTLLRGEVFARWQEYVGAGDLFSALLARVGRLRDRVASVVSGRPKGGRALKDAIRSSLATLIRGAATDAAEQAAAAWRAEPAAAGLLAGGPSGGPSDPARPAIPETAGPGRSPAGPSPADLGRPSEDLDWRVERLVREWQRDVLRLVRAETAGERAGSRVAAYAVNATGLLVMIGACTPATTGSVGPETAVAGDPTGLAQQVLEAVHGDPAIRDLADRAREDLLARVRALFDAEQRRFLDRVAAAGVDERAPERLRRVAAAVLRAASPPAPAGAAEPHVPEQRSAPAPETTPQEHDAVIRPEWPPRPRRVS
jgi:hypothetical protein